MRSRTSTFAIGLCLLLPHVNSAADDKRALNAAELPPAGYARLYVFRPDFSDVSREDSPVLMIDGTEVVKLAHKAYTSVVLRPGSHELATAPSVGEAGFWNGKLQISVQADTRHFVAVWNDFQVGAGSLSSITPYLGLLGVAMDSSVRSTAVRFELINEDDALAAIRELSFLPPSR